MQTKSSCIMRTEDALPEVSFFLLEWELITANFLTCEQTYCGLFLLHTEPIRKYLTRQEMPEGDNTLKLIWPRQQWWRKKFNNIDTWCFNMRSSVSHNQLIFMAYYQAECLLGTCVKKKQNFKLKIGDYFCEAAVSINEIVPIRKRCWPV